MMSHPAPRRIRLCVTQAVQRVSAALTPPGDHLQARLGVQELRSQAYPLHITSLLCMFVRYAWRQGGES